MSDFFSNNVKLLILLLSLPSHVLSNFILNQTGGSFPNSVYLQTTFSYNFVEPTVSLSYYGPSSTVGKCNTMGYWHTANNGFNENLIPLSVKKFDQAVCTDKCTLATCGYTPRTNASYVLAGTNYNKLTIRRDASRRIPLTDIGASDGLLGAADYLNFPDIQMLPATAGAVVPIYNIPELVALHIVDPLILSRSSLVNIFMGKITLWNDPSILADNAANLLVLKVLTSLSTAISIVVRTDSSGTSEIFSDALDAMSPAGYAITQTGLVANSDGSFHDQVTPSGGSQSPFWCGPLTDELQYITVTGCNPAAASKLLTFRMIDASYKSKNVTFNCDSSARTVRSAILSATLLDVHVTVTTLSVRMNSNTTQIEIGYGGLKQQRKNWYNPILLSAPSGVAVTVKAKQEGGYLNTVTTCTAKPTTAQTMSIWILVGNNIQFSLAWTSLDGASRNTSSIQYIGTDISASIMSSINLVLPGSVTSVIQVPRGTWTEFRTVLTASTKSSFTTLKAVTLPSSSNNTFVNTLTDFSNYPCFYDSKHPRGYASSGRYTCYMRQSNFTAYSYYTGNSNLGVVAEVISRPYSIGYSILEIALTMNLSAASMINKAGATVVATSQSVAFAVMNQGGNLNSLFQASLVDGTSSNVWPISGFTYFIIRNNHHIAPGNCPRRSAAMEYLYNFYNSPTVEIAAQTLGFAALPQFIASIILQQLVDHAMCDDGTYALAKHHISPSPLLGASVFKSTIVEYISAYTAVDSTAVWQSSYSDNSASLYEKYARNPAAVSGVFTMFSSRAEKLRRYNSTNILTTSFAHVAVVPLYHLNAFTSTANSRALRMTTEIIGGILSGKISMWNDSAIQAANAGLNAVLPYQPIIVVIRPQISDTNSLLIRYLTEQSPTFRAALNASGTTSLHQFNTTSLIPPNRILYAETNDIVDSLVTTFDGSFGYYLKNKSPIAGIASFCRDATCSPGIVDPSVVSSINVCELDSNTVVNPRANLYTYDLMSSTAVGCYPITGTVDYSLLATTDNTCSHTNLSSNSVLKDRIRFGSWLFSTEVVVQPLAASSIGATPALLRQQTFEQICQVTCNGVMYGYEYCGYRDCSYAAGDYRQVESSCDPSTEERTVTYELIGGSNATCIHNPNTIPPPFILVGCYDVLAHYKYGKLVSSLSIIGMTICAAVLFFVLYYRAEKVIKKSQPIFIYIFIVGAFLMNLSILVLVGPNDDNLCLLRPWTVDISTTIMFAPLLMKLHRIDMLFRLSKRLKKVRIPDYMVALHVLGLVSVDVFILLLWTFLDRPRGLSYLSSAGGLYKPVLFTACSTNLNSPFERAMVAWKAILLGAGVYKSICTWDMPSDIAEVKHFFLAIYNVSVVGGAMYFFSLYGSTSAGSFVLLRCVGIFVSATLPVLIIMIPKFTVIQYKNITGKNLWAASKKFAERVSSSNSKSKESYMESDALKCKEVMSRLRNNYSAKVLPDVREKDETGGESARSNVSSGSRKRSTKLLENSFTSADKIANEEMNRNLFRDRKAYLDKEEYEKDEGNEGAGEGGKGGAGGGVGPVIPGP